MNTAVNDIFIVQNPENPAQSISYDNCDGTLLSEVSIGGYLVSSVGGLNIFVLFISGNKYF